MSGQLNGQLDGAVRRWRRYPAYKDSGLPWAPEIPAHWEMRRLKYLAAVRPSNVDKKSAEGEKAVRLCNYVDVYKNDYITDALAFMRATATDSQAATFSLRPGDVIITKDSESWDDIAVPAFVPSPLDGVVCGYHLALIRPNPKRIDGEYLFRCFMAEGVCDQFRVVANGITRFGLGTEAISDSLFPVPPPDEQRRIAVVLASDTAKIDALILKKERLIELLQEKRAAIINQAVTKGLDPLVTMKNPESKWMTDLPSHWQVKRLKHAASIQTGLTLGKDYAGQRTVLRPYLRVANVQDGYLDLDKVTEVSVPADDASRHELRSGDVLMTEGGDFDKLGRGYVWEGQIEGCLHQNHIFAVRPNGTVLDPRFLASLMTSAHGKNYFTATSQQTTNLASTNSTKLKNFPLPLPSTVEQRAIIGSLDEKAGKIDLLIAKVRQGIERLREYRTALISAAVTGKIDVRQEVEP